ncbi:amino acid permease/ SLC12A domain-containing protein [Nemania abortiva]|nr:amino acid permease/ SLC12A domain-containing protein [Nemania abortiva]
MLRSTYLYESWESQIWRFLHGGLFSRCPDLSFPSLSSDAQHQRSTQSPRSKRIKVSATPDRPANVFLGNTSNNSDSALSTSGPDPGRNPSDGPMPETSPSEDPQYTYEICLTPFQIFMITLNATLGAGLYWRAGQILELGGAVAVLVSFILLTVLAWAVMQCIGEMLGRWPAPGAISVFVSNFVDYELGIAVGIMYWLTYSVSFAALIATSASEIRYWIRNGSFEATVVYITIPLILIILNCFPVKYYGRVEVIFGTLKLLFFFIIIVAMIFLYWNKTDVWDIHASTTRGPAFLTAISTAVFAFIGIEVVAACALEAKPPVSNTTITSSNDSRTTVMSSKTRFSLIYFSLIVGAAYTVSGLLTTFNVPHDACDLPHLSWLSYSGPYNIPYSGRNTSSAFVLAAELHNSKALASTFNFFLVFTALSSAQTNLYVASRALYGLATQLRRSEAKFLEILSFLGETNGRGVPVRAVVVSALAFIWIPFLQLQGYNQTPDNSDQDNNNIVSAGISSFIDILSQLGSVGVIIVWACECLAFLSYRHYLKKHGDYLKDNDPNYVDRKDHTKYPYRSHFQPIVGSLAFAGCLFILLVLDSAALYHGFHIEPFLSQYLAVIIFAALWALLKVYRRRKLGRNYYFDVDLSAPGFHETLKRLSGLTYQ